MPHRSNHSPSSSSQWHQISPSTRPLNLEVLEITSLSITISLSLASQPKFNSRHRSSSNGGSHAPKHRRKHRNRNTESDDELTAVEDDSYPSSSTGHISSSHTPPYASAPVPGSYPSRLPLSPNAKPSFKELLSKGVVVTLNGQPWTRIVAHVSDESGESPSYPSGGIHTPPESTDGDHPGGHREVRFGTGEGCDRAVVVIYGLGPGKEYEVDLRVVGNLGDDAGNGEGSSGGMHAGEWPYTLEYDVQLKRLIVHIAFSASTKVTTPSSSLQVHTPTGNRSRANSIRKNNTRSRSSSLVQPETGSSTDTHLPASQSVPMVNPSPSSVSSETQSQAMQLHHQLSLTTAERDLLISNLKKSRRESQRTEATLKSEIETLKRSSEKTTQPDLRNRQKSLALQEQVKQGWNGAADAEREHGEILNGMGELHGLEQGVREEWGVVRSERDHAVEDKDDALEADRKALAELEGELNAISSKLDKQVGKRDKLKKENEELTSKLEEVAAAQREVEKRNEMIRQQRLLAEDYGGPGGISGMGGLYAGERSRPGSLLNGQSGAGPWGDYDSPWGGGGVRSGGPRLHQSSMGNLSGAASGGGDHSGPAYVGDPRNRQISANHPPRTFFPASQRSASGPAVSGGGQAAAMATQGLPRPSNAPLSHLGNPIGFFPPSPAASTSPGPTTAASVAGDRPVARSFRVLSREGHQSGSAGTAPVSPLMANVTAAPFLPNSMLNQSTSNSAPPSANYGSTFDYHTTSLVPPPLQHRIYLPGNRNRSGQSNPGPVANRHRDPLRRSSASGESVDGSGTPQTSPSFPPLPSQNSSVAVSIKAPVASGPTLASIINRAIIPSSSSSVSSNSSTIHAGQSYSTAPQKSPATSVHDSDHAHSPVGGSSGAPVRPPPLTRPLSWNSQSSGGVKQPQSFADALAESPTQSHSPINQGGPANGFPPLPVSPTSPWSITSGGGASPLGFKGPTPPGSVGISNSASGSASGTGSGSGSGGWQGKGRRDSFKTKEEAPAN